MNDSVVLEKLDRLLEEVEELKGLVKRAKPEQYTPEEAFWKALEDMKYGIHPAWLRGLDIPLEVFERFFVPYLVYEGDVHGAVKYFVKKGYISVRMQKWQDAFGKTHRMKVVYLSNDVLEEEPPQDTLAALTWSFFSAYRSIFKQPLTRGTMVEDYDKVITQVVRWRLHWYFEPFIERKILYTERDLKEWALEIDDLNLVNSMVHAGFAEWASEGDDAPLRILVDEWEIFKRISSQPEGGA